MQDPLKSEACYVHVQLKHAADQYAFMQMSDLGLTAQSGVLGTDWCNAIFAGTLLVLPAQVAEVFKCCKR